MSGMEHGMAGLPLDPRLSPPSLTSAVPSLGPSILAPWDVIGGSVNSVGAPAANYAFGQRCVASMSGTLSKISVYISASAGNIDVGLYAIFGDDRILMESSGSTPVGAGSSWQTFAVDHRAHRAAGDRRPG